MKDIELLFKNNYCNNDKQCKRIIKLQPFQNGQKMWYYCNKNKVYSGEDIAKLLNGISYILRTDKYKLPIYLDLNTVEFVDKLVYVVLECICYYLIFYKNIKLTINLSPKRKICTEGIIYSPLVNNLNFIKRFKKDFQPKHYREIIEYNSIKTDYLTGISSNIFFFFSHLGITDDVNSELTEAITELIGNAIEHGNSDCLFDIDVTNKNYCKLTPEKQIDTSVNYYGINVVVLNFSNKLLHHELKNRLYNPVQLSSRYKLVYGAKNYHMNHLNENYKEDDFYTLTAFQHKISGDINKKEAGGVGLTSLIKSLEEKPVSLRNCQLVISTLYSSPA